LSNFGVPISKICRKKFDLNNNFAIVSHFGYV
jgi:hypothetical protein